jgi:protein involved in polysaccharide export with SLBB domain
MDGRLVVVALLASLVLTGCPTKTQVPPSNLPTAPIPVAVPNGEGVLGPEDVVEIRVFREEELSSEYRVEADGTINFPLIGSVEVDGLTPTEASKIIDWLLEDGFLKDAQVTIRVIEFNSRQITVLGRVKAPGSYPYSDGMTIVQAIALAGGLEEGHAAYRMTITRGEGADQLVIKVPFGEVSKGRARNVEMQPSDVVFVPESPI